MPIFSFQLEPNTHTGKIQTILSQYWGHPAFRPLQEEIITAVLAGKDVVALLPTGGGKSICYQVPALAMEGLCLVVSPLIALMKDQVENLRQRGIPALALYAGMSRNEVKQSLIRAARGEVKLLYVSPERLETALFNEYLPALGIGLLAVDEAHCISQWGYDFRPPYLRIAALRDQLPGLPVLALTASATQRVQDDIADKLLMKAPAIFRQSFERPNLSYSVFYSEAKISKLTEILNRVPGTAIVYCRSRKRTVEISRSLQQAGISADFYHAGIAAAERTARQTAWMQNRTRVMVCTNAFGMGIDKPDVRTVVHLDMPDCLENYYQEAGRAGRDGKSAYAVLLYDERGPQELREGIQVRFPDMDTIRQVYQSLVNYLQLPAGSGKEQYFDFHPEDMARRFSLDSRKTWYALKTLEQEGWLAINEQAFTPSTIGFVADRQALRIFEEANPGQEELIKTLLRTYEGIFDFPVSISEMRLAGLLKTQIETIKAQLLQLRANGIIAYHPQKENPQVYFFHDRVPGHDLRIDMKAYLERKRLYAERVETMIAYTNLNDCRSQFTGRYFGDDKMSECGICDNCLRKKKKALNPSTFDLLSAQILAAIKDNGTTTSEILQPFSSIEKEKAWQVLEFLQAEEKITVDEKGVWRRGEV